MQHDATLGYVLTPHAVRTLQYPEHTRGGFEARTNNLGLRRDADTVAVPPHGVTRLLVLGDSQSEGYVDNRQTFSALLERGLNRVIERSASERESHIEVLNGAVGGYSPLLEYLWLQTHGAALHPNAVLLTLFAGNDIAELLIHHADFGGFGPTFKLPFLEADGTAFRIVLPGATEGWLARLDWRATSSSRLYALVHRVLAHPAVPSDSPMARVAASCVGCAQSLWQASMAHGELRELEPGFAKLDYLLQQFHDEADRLHVPLTVAVLPTKIEVEGQRVMPDVQSAMATLALSYDPIAFERGVRERMLALAAAHGFTPIDLFPALHAAFDAQQRPLYWDLDWHLNAEGHRVVARSLMQHRAELVPHLTQEE